MDTLFRTALIEQAIETASGTIPISFASEQLVKRTDKKHGIYWERLSHSPGDANFGLLNTEGIVLSDHDETRQVGTVIPGSAAVSADRKSRAKIRITDSDWKNRVAKGERPGVSVGYRQLSVVHRSVSEIDGWPILEFSWAPYEISLLNQKPADSTVGLYRNMNTLLTDELLKLAISGSRRNDGTFTRAQMTEEFSLTEYIRSGSDFFGESELTGIYRSVKESCHYLDGSGRSFPVSGLLTPFEAFLPKYRDLTSTNFASGGALVESTMHPAVELLLNKVAAVPLGATVISGLAGNFIAPKITKGINPQSLPETAQANTSQPVSAQDAMMPLRVSVPIQISTQLLKQTGGGTEQIVRALIRNQIAQKIDSLVLLGRGAFNEPTGILNSDGVGEVTYGGAATWPNVLLSEKSLADNNADVGPSLGWAISTATRNKWKQASRIAATNFPSFIMEGGQINDYAAIATTTLSAGDRSIFGRWEDCWILIWGTAADLVVDPYKLASSGLTVITATILFNVWLPHGGASFCVSSDSAAQ